LISAPSAAITAKTILTIQNRAEKEDATISSSAWNAGMILEEKEIPGFGERPSRGRNSRMTGRTPNAPYAPIRLIHVYVN